MVNDLEKKWPGSDLLCEPRIKGGRVRLDFDPLSLWLERAGQGLVTSSSGDTRSPCSGRLAIPPALRVPPPPHGETTIGTCPQPLRPW